MVPFLSKIDSVGTHEVELKRITHTTRRSCDAMLLWRDAVVAAVEAVAVSAAAPFAFAVVGFELETSASAATAAWV